MVVKIIDLKKIFNIFYSFEFTGYNNQDLIKPSTKENAV